MTDRHRMGCWIGVVFLLGLGIFSPPGNGESKAYKWTDSNGVVHFTDDLNKIPPEYRGKIEKEYDFKDAEGDSGKSGELPKEQKEKPKAEKPS